jgi:catechol 2,3-dioxygenase-like lactoylglutathione lyase family enzyme
MITHLAVVTLWAEDVPATAHFYRDVLGLRLLPHHHGGRPHFDLGGTFLTLLPGKPQPALDSQPPRFPVLAFAVDDLDGMAARLQAHGVALPWGIEQDADSRWAMFHDPAGNLVEVAELGRPSGE